MHKLLSDVIQKLGLKTGEMTEEEKQTFDTWNHVLSEDEITVERVAEFCERMQFAIESKWTNKYRDRTNDPFLADIHSVYGTIKRLITSKKSEREALEVQLQKMLDTPTTSDL